MKNKNNEKYNKNLSDVFRNYNNKKWVNPNKNNNLTLPFIWGLIGILQPHNKSNKNNYNPYKKY